MNRLSFAIIVITLLNMTHIVTAQSTRPTTEPSDVISLWPAGAVPESLGSDPVKDIPTLSLFLPDPAKASGAAMVVCPGGGYSHLAPHEGKDYALWLADHGIASFVLKYRLGSGGYHHPVMMHDVQRAVRLVRARAEEWKVDPKRIGVMGSSAGGHLTATAVTHFDNGNPDASDPMDRVSCRPSLGILCYAVISMGPKGHQGSKDNLLGKDPSPELVALMSNELQVTKETPPCFIWHTRDDSTVPVANSQMFADALERNGVPYELHIYQTGHHGLGLGVHNYDPATTSPSKLLSWTHDLEAWLKLQHFVK